MNNLSHYRQSSIAGRANQKNFTREELKKKKKKVGDLQLEIETLQANLYQTKEDLNSYLERKQRLTLCYDQ